MPLKDLQVKVPYCILPLTPLDDGNSNLTLKDICGWGRKPGCFMMSDSFRFSIFSPSQSCGQVTRLASPKGWPSLEALYTYNHPCFFRRFWPFCFLLKVFPCKSYLPVCSLYWPPLCIFYTSLHDALQIWNGPSDFCCFCLPGISIHFLLLCLF